jgi:hypothetical protein
MRVPILALFLWPACTEPCPDGATRWESDGLCHLSEADSAETQDTGEVAGEPATFTDIQQDVFQVSCAYSTCHGDSDGVGSLSLEADGTYAALVGVASTVVEGAILVVPGDADGSYLIAKMEEADSIEGLPMPPAGPLDQDVIDTVRAWIDGGALDN